MFDPIPYLRLVVTDAPTAIAVGHSLIQAEPENLPKEAKRALRRLVGSVEDLQREFEKSAPAAEADKRPADAALDTAWGALRTRLEGSALLAGLPDAPAKCVRARELLTELFPEGSGFLTLAYQAEWAESQKILARIDGKTASEIDSIAGKEHLQAVRAAHEQYGQVLGITAPSEAPDANAAKISSALMAVRKAMSAYALGVLATVDEDDEATVTAAQRALAPIETQRRMATKRAKASAGKGAAPATPADPDAKPAPNA